MNSPSCALSLNLQALDYEEIKVLKLEVAVSNKAQYNFGSGSTTGGAITQKFYPIKINVINQNEGPRFQPSVKVVTISEDHTSISLNKIITTYTAIDTETLQTVTNVRYRTIMKDVTEQQICRHISCVFEFMSFTLISYCCPHKHGFSYSQVC